MVARDESVPASSLSREFVGQAVEKAVQECLRELRRNLPQHRSALELFNSDEAEAAKIEMAAVGHKLWLRQYVDGNGGNISYRLAPGYILSTPTLHSKGDLKPEDISLVDMDNHQLYGDRPRTSEIKLHIEIYKAVPQARAILHCHPPYATAHAVAGFAPQGNLVPEQEIFVGPVALAPYATPGSDAVSCSVLPYVANHNAILLANHGLVCWADTLTHAEWYAEVVENYCKTTFIAHQLNPSLKEISPAGIQDLLEIKQKMGLPDPRLNGYGGETQNSPAEPFAAVSASTPEELIAELRERLFSYFSGR
jgi:L-fuculose-phosphate aldolase